MAEKKTNKRTPVAGREPDGPLDLGWLERVVRLMADHDLNTVDVRDGAGGRVILKRGQPVVSVAGLPAAAAFDASAPPAPATLAGPTAGRAGAAPPTTAPAAADSEANLVPIPSPMPGTFYTAPKPGEKPFVAVGSTVDEDTDVCIIEAMKTFNSVKAGVRGTIVKALVQNGQTVQFDQPLFLVRPA